MEVFASQLQALNTSVESLTRCFGGVHERLEALKEADKIMDTGLKTVNLNLTSNANQKILEVEQGQRATVTKAIATEVEGGLKMVQDQFKKMEEGKLATLEEQLKYMDDRRSMRIMEGYITKLEERAQNADQYANVMGARLIALEEKMTELQEVVEIRN